MTMLLPLTFRLSRNWIYLVTSALLCILVFQLMSIRDSTGHADFNPLLRGDVAKYLTNLTYYFPIELVTVGVMLGILSLYRKWLRLYSIVPTPLSLLRYQFVYLPAILVGIGIVCPVTNTLRYFVLYVGEYGWAYYFPQYCFTWRMYFLYLIPVLLFSYGFLNVNLVLDYMSWHRHLLLRIKATRQTAPPDIRTTITLSTSEQVINEQEIGRQGANTGSVNEKETTQSTGLPYLASIDVFDQRGQTRMSLNHVCYFAVHGKIYQAHTIDRTYTIHMTFGQLIPQLDPHQFLRISRGVVVNIQYVDNYSHWEYDKFIVRLKDDSHEFVMQRSHLGALKALLATRE